MSDVAGVATVIFAGGSLVLRDRVVLADLTIEVGGTISSIDASIGAAPSPHATIVDCTGCDVLPGFVDLHTDNIERHVEQRPGIFSSPERAILAHDAELAGAGVTTACDAITLGGGFSNDTRRALSARVIPAVTLARREGALRVDHHIHLRCELSDAGLPLLLQDVERGGEVRPRIVSLMNHTPGQRQWRDLTKFRAYYLRRYNLSDAELAEVIVARQASEAAVVPANCRLAIDLAARVNARLASHDDTEPHDVDEAAASGCVLSEFPTTLAAAARASALGLHVIAGAPNLVRGASHSGNISAIELARAGHLHAIASDYSPSSLLDAVYLLRDRDGWTLPDAVRAVSLTPAHAIGLDDRGELAPGRRADVIVVSHTALGAVLRETWAAGRRVF